MITRSRIIAPEWRVLGGWAAVCNGDWRLCGAVLRPDQPWERNRLLNCFPGTPMQTETGVRLYYSLSTLADDGYRLAVAEFDADWRARKHPLSDRPADAACLDGLPADCLAIQPNVLRLDEEHWRMYFWMHRRGAEPLCRFMTAESGDGLHWRLAPEAVPVLYQFNDSAVSAGRVPPALRCNDATTVLRRPDGGWELYSASLVEVGRLSPRYIPADLAAGKVRIIQRWTGEDGLRWNAPEVVMTPDENDAADLQFYYLLPSELPRGSFALLGRYEAGRQRLRMEMAYSFDRRHWQRGPRENIFPLPPGIGSVVPAQRLLPLGGKLVLFYNNSNFDHNFRTADGSAPAVPVDRAEIDVGRVIGRHLRGAAVLSPPLRLVGDSVRLWLAEDAALTVEWRDAFGDGIGVPPEALPSGGCRIIPVPRRLAGAVGRLRLTGNGRFFDLEY